MNTASLAGVSFSNEEPFQVVSFLASLRHPKAGSKKTFNVHVIHHVHGVWAFLHGMFAGNFLGQRRTLPMRRGGSGGGGLGHHLYVRLPQDAAGWLDPARCVSMRLECQVLLRCEGVILTGSINRGSLILGE